MFCYYIYHVLILKNLQHVLAKIQIPLPKDKRKCIYKNVKILHTKKKTDQGDVTKEYLKSSLLGETLKWLVKEKRNNTVKQES